MLFIVVWLSHRPFKLNVMDLEMNTAYEICKQSI